ncbi:hypothetical protein LXH13_11830 [Streptomyces spinosirectus]|nr:MULTISPECIES: hypothetical protein [Streptomyces]UIR17683.1 hypothetical protein LXH13_11830 [Streptomyces spinosirectus]
MGDTGGRSSVPPARRQPGRRQEPTVMPRLGIYALIVFVLAVAAAVVSFAQGSWLGIVWILLAGLSSNMCWYYLKRGRAEQRTGAAYQKR